MQSRRTLNSDLTTEDCRILRIEFSRHLDHEARRSVGHQVPIGQVGGENLGAVSCFRRQSERGQKY